MSRYRHSEYQPLVLIAWAPFSPSFWTGSTAFALAFCAASASVADGLGPNDRRRRGWSVSVAEPKSWLSVPHVPYIAAACLPPVGRARTQKANEGYMNMHTHRRAYRYGCIGACMYICIYVHTCMHKLHTHTQTCTAFTHTNTCAYAYARIGVRTRMRLRRSTYTYKYSSAQNTQSLYTCTCGCTCTCLFLCICRYLCICVCISVCTAFIHVHTHVGFLLY